MPFSFAFMRSVAETEKEKRKVKERVICSYSNGEYRHVICGQIKSYHQQKSKVYT